MDSNKCTALLGFATAAQSCVVLLINLLQMLGYDGKAEAAQFCFEKATVRYENYIIK